MSNDFTRTLNAVVHSLSGHKPTQQQEAAPRSQWDAIDDRTEWFARFASERVMPLLEQSAQALRKRSYGVAARLRETDGRLVAGLEIVPPGLPAGARPPRLIITAARPPRLRNAPAAHDRPLVVEYGGTFPPVGATGRFSGEIDYDTVYPSQLEERPLDFIKLATGA